MRSLAAGTRNSKCRRCKVAAAKDLKTQRQRLRLARLNEAGVKWCGGCDRELPVEQFAKFRRAHDGLQTECRECHSIRAQQERLEASFFVCGPVWTEDEAEWKQQAACKDLPSEWWLDNPYSRNDILTANAVRAKRVCAECPVIEKCRALNDAIEIGISRNTYIGLWAGETIPERMERRRREAVHAA